MALFRDEALMVVRNSAKGQGLDAWRRRNRECEPNNEVANLRLLKRALHPTQESVEHLRGCLEPWDREYRTYCERTGETRSDPIRRLTCHSMCPSALQEHLDFHVARLGTYDLLRQVVDEFVDRKLALQVGGATDMEVDAVSKSKGKGKPPQARLGIAPAAAADIATASPIAKHTERDCCHNPRNPAPEALARREACKRTIAPRGLRPRLVGPRERRGGSEGGQLRRRGCPTRFIRGSLGSPPGVRRKRGGHRTSLRVWLRARIVGLIGRHLRRVSGRPARRSLRFVAQRAAAWA